MHPPNGTISCLALNSKGEMSGVTTTSGLAWKIPGRAGDSPTIGAGLYVDQDAGGAGSTGRGEENIRIAGAHTIVENMRRGMTPKEACLDALKRVARNFDNDVPKDSPHALVLNLMASPSKSPDPTGVCQRSLAYFAGPMLDNPQWVHDTLRYLPDTFRFHGTLFLTYGYDIGVAFGPSASLNCTHPHFDEHPRELLYYAIHELHHVGFMSIKPPRKFSDVKTCRDLLWIAQYHTQLEGMAVLAAWQRRREEHALNDDKDYVALQDEAEMEREEALYFDKLKYLKDRGEQPADKEAWAIVETLSAQRLWYRVGARMAHRIERTSGRAALIALIGDSPEQFIAAYRKAVVRSQ